MAESEETGLAQYDNMIVAIANAERADEAKEIKNRARAMQVYAQQAHNRKAEQRCATIRIRAERRLGQMLKDQEMHKGGRPAKTGNTRAPVSDEPIRLSEVNITKRESSQAQKLADIPDQEFEDAIAAAEATNTVPTTTSILDGVKKQRDTTRQVGMTDEQINDLAVIRAYSEIPLDRFADADLLTQQEVRDLMTKCDRVTKGLWMRNDSPR